MRKKVLAQLIRLSSFRKKEQALRYLICLGILYPDGCVDIQQVSPVLAKLFNVQPKSVKNYIFKMADMGWGKFNKDYSQFYFRSQEKLIELLGEEPNSQKAVYVGLEDMEGSIVKVRAFFHAAYLSSFGDTKTITRDCLTKLVNVERRTQRKYNKLNGIKTNFNYAVIDEYSEHTFERALQSEGHAFVFKDRENHFKKGSKKKYVARQIANTYHTPLVRKKKKIYVKSSVPTEIVADRGTLDKTVKLYFSESDAAYKYWSRHKTDVYWKVQRSVWGRYTAA